MDGLQKAIPGATIATAPRDITLLRERKSKAELDLLKCANEVSGVTYSRRVVVDKNIPGYIIGHSGGAGKDVYWDA
jgi:hypothetical protein